MPTYEYKCLNCSHTFEVFQSMNAKLIEECPKCGGKVKRLIGAGAGPIFKGNGFYQTDYKNSSKSSSETKKPIENKPSKDSSTKK
ncbi:MAG: FmdB family zinc ribbon protein [Ignavibacteriaceae bacterium]